MVVLNINLRLESQELFCLDCNHNTQLALLCPIALSAGVLQSSKQKQKLTPIFRALLSESLSSYPVCAGLNAKQPVAFDLPKRKPKGGISVFARPI